VHPIVDKILDGDGESSVIVATVRREFDFDPGNDHVARSRERAIRQATPAISIRRGANCPLMLLRRRFTTAALQAIHEEAAGRDLCFGQGFPRPQPFCEPASLVTAFLAAANLMIEARTSTPRLSRG
jgi:hypothetical protein